jgi:DNA-binding SARP family transcriptional activator
MNTLEVRLFGGLSVSLSGEPIGSFPTRWSAGLFAYLALNRGRYVHRDLLAALFWPEDTEERARKALRNALWRVRTIVEPPGIAAETFLKVNRRDVGIRPEEVWVDAVEFDRKVATARATHPGPPDVDLLEECVGLHRGPFLDGLDFEWSSYERERMLLDLLSVLERMVGYHMERREWALAIHRGRMLLAYDPLREHVHRCLMACHHLMGNRPLAIRQYRECVKLLEAELGIGPMAATQTLYQEIKADAVRQEGAVRNTLSA